MAMEASRRAADPFEFKSAAHLLFIEKERACNIGELARALRGDRRAGTYVAHVLRRIPENESYPVPFVAEIEHGAFSLAARRSGNSERH